MRVRPARRRAHGKADQSERRLSRSLLSVAGFRSRPARAMIARVHRKVVTVLFCDVVGSTALGESVDPEALQGLLARYFERMKAIVESHGGSVEKFIGDAVMAVFGVPEVHEDDALRACRAAVEMRGRRSPSSASRGGSASTPARS